MKTSSALAYLMVSLAIAASTTACSNATSTQADEGDASQPVIVNDTGSAAQDGATTAQATLTNGTGYEAVELAVRAAGTQTWSGNLLQADTTLSPGDTVTITYDVATQSDGTQLYDVMLTTAGGGTIVTRNVDLGAQEIALRFDEGIGYVTHTDANGDTVSTYDESVEANLSDDAPTYDMQTQLD